MRPVPSGNRPINSRPPQRPDTLTCGPSTAPVACFITSEANLETRRGRSPPRHRQHPDQRKWGHSSPPSQPSQSTISPAHVPRSISSSSADDQETLAYPSHPGTPFFLGLSEPESVLSSTSSQRSSLAGPSLDHQSDPIEDDASLPEPAMADLKDNDSSVPQLIMPSLTVPRRRPFSHVGKSLGKVKIMVAGRPGIGKTSLIWSLAQRCEHIVHIDQIEPNGITRVSEFYASSKPHPWWKADSQVALTNARRSSLTAGEMLDRNVCFVECPGRTNGFPSSWQDLSYVKSNLTALLSKRMDDADLLALLDAGGEPIVDALLYLIPHKGLEFEDVEYIKHAQQMTNVIPVLARADELTSDEIAMARQRIATSFAEENLECFSFASLESAADATSGIYAISTETRTDYDTMDASVLMDSNYMTPLVPTDLSKLIERMFSLDGTAQLRHSAAVKGVEWRQKYTYGALQNSLQSRSMVHVSAMRPGPIQRAQCWERLEFYNWANNLRQSLHAEQLRYILNEKSVNTVVSRSQLIPIASRGDKPRPSKASRRSVRGSNQRHQDPLGILDFGGKLKQKGILALEMATSIGLVGYIITQLVRAEWAEETCSVPFTGSKRIGMEVPGLGTIVFW